MAIAMVLAAPAAMAQKINESAVRAKMEKSEAEINDAKKAVAAVDQNGSIEDIIKRALAKLM